MGKPSFPRNILGSPFHPGFALSGNGEAMAAAQAASQWQAMQNANNTSLDSTWGMSSPISSFNNSSPGSPVSPIGFNDQNAWQNFIHASMGGGQAMNTTISSVDSVPKTEQYQDDSNTNNMKKDSTPMQPQQSYSPAPTAAEQMGVFDQQQGKSSTPSKEQFYGNIREENQQTSASSYLPIYTNTSATSPQSYFQPETFRDTAKHMARDAFVNQMMNDNTKKNMTTPPTTPSRDGNWIPHPNEAGLVRDSLEERSRAIEAK